MATEKVTPMVLKVDLQCPCCYKKIKKTLCKFPQIRDQVYNEKGNEVYIKVVCCSPEKIRDKLCSKGGKAIQSIHIVDKPKEPEKKPDKPKAADTPKAAADKPKEPEKPKEKPKDKPAEAEKPKGDGKGDKAGGAPAPQAEKPKGDGKGDKAGGAPAPQAEKPKEAPKPEPAKNAEPGAPISAAALQVMGSGPALVHGVPSVFPYVGPSHDAYAAGPYYHGYGFPPPPPQPLYDVGYYGYGHGHEQGYGYGQRGGVSHGHVHRCDNYFSEENPQTCSIM